MGEQNKPQEGKSMTAEEVANNFLHSESDLTDIIDAMKEYAAQQTAALREELDLYKGYDKERVKVINDFGQEKLRRLELEKELEAVKQERDGLRNVKKSVESLIASKNKMLNHVKYQLSEVTRQRDEAVKLLLKWRGDLIDGCGPANCIDEFLSRLSSGETKPPDFPDSSKVSPWISVEERLPEIGESVYFYDNLFKIVHPGDYLNSLNKERCFFSYSGSRIYHVSKWCARPVPAPPEPLTDKK